jgi:asparagine synthase (glutamine-hydrolysing)
MSNTLRSRMRAIAGLWSPGNPALADACFSVLGQISSSPASIRQPAPDLVFGSSDYRADPVASPGPPSRPSSLAAFVADLRIDNLDDLAPELGLPPTASDDEVFAAAWTRWNFRMLDHLIGGFAFACWDPERRTLFLARDHTGERPLHFTRSLNANGGFAFASMPHALCALPSVGHRIHVPHAAHFLTALDRRGTDTFFAGVEVLPPAHWIKVSPAGMEVRRYWHPIDAPAIRYRRDSEYIDDFRERFDRAVGARLSDCGNIASQLSGGLDSSSVTVTAARLLTPGRHLTSFTAVPVPGFDGSALFGRFGDEGPMAAEVAALYSNIDHVLVNATGQNLVASFQRDARLTGEPAFNPTNLLWMDAVREAMRRRGLHVLLQGAGGNATISFGGLIGLSDLFRRGQWIKLFRLTRELRAGGHTSWRGAASWATGSLIPSSLRRLYHPDMRNFSLDFTAVHPQLASEFHLREKALEEFYGVETSTASVRRSLYDYYDPGVHNGAVAAGWQIEQRDPTQDKRIFEFCFGIPIDQFLVDGQSRSVIRRAMQGRLPDSTLRRTTRGLQAADWSLTVRRALPQLSAELTRTERSPLARHVIDTARLRTLLDTFPDSGYHTSEVCDAWHLALTRGIAAASFLADHDPEMPRDEAPTATEKPGMRRASDG